MSRQGKAHELWYVTSPHSVRVLESHAQKTGAKAKVVYFTALLFSFTDGAERFSQRLASDPERQVLATSRMKQWIRFLPSALLEEQNDR